MSNIKQRGLRLVAVLIGVVTIAGGPTYATVLYDATQQTVPASQGWTFFPVGPTTQTLSTSGVTLDTTLSNSTQAGYFRSDHALDADAGYTLGFEARLISESHATNDRAGFSVIVVSSDITKALEIAFWDDEVWAQNDGVNLFTHGESAPFDTTAGIIRYDLTVNGSSYELVADGTSILTGSMRDYTPFSGFPDVYEIPNFIFLGDDTSSARASVEIAFVELNPIPEPASLTLFSLGCLLLSRRRARQADYQH